MPGSNTGHLTQTTMGLTGQLFCVHPPTLVSVTLGNTDNVNHLILTKDVNDGNGLLKLLSGPVNLISNGASVQLNLHQVGLLLSVGQQAHLQKAGWLVKLHLKENAIFFLQLLLALFILPPLAVLGKGLLLGLVPEHEATLALITNVLSKDGLERAQATRGHDISNNTHYNHGRSLHNGHSRSVDLTDNVGHASLVAKERGQVNRLAGIIFRETLHLATMAFAPLAGQEAQRAMARTGRFTKTDFTLNGLPPGNTRQHKKTLTVPLSSD
uniref:Uncharacterized protein n=1 Tax=Sinocyclocheilus rhinocerous TaxID=307959 RepID=A0A673HBF9_9TELE